MYSWAKVQRSVSVLIPQNEMMIFKFKYFPQPGEFTANWSQVSKILSFIIFSSNGSRVQVMSCHHHPLLPDAYNYCVIHQKRVTWLMIGSWFFCTDKKLWPNYCLLEYEANKTNLLLMSILKLIYTPGQIYLQCKFYMFYSRTCWLLSVIRLTGLEVICIASLSVWASRKWPSYVSWQFLPFPFRPHFPWRKCNIQRRLFSCTFLLSDSPRYICMCILLYFIQVWI